MHFTCEKMIASKQDKEIIQRSIRENKARLLNQKVLIFGCTLYGRDIRDELVSCGIKLCGFIDNNKNKIGKDCLGVPVDLPEKMLVPYSKELCVIICSKYQQEMARQVLKYGYDKENLLIIDVAEAGNHVLDDLDSARNAYEDVKKGYALYLNIIENYKTKDKLFVCPYPGTGDIYMTCIYLPAYLKEHSIEEYALVVGSEGCKKVCNIFHIENVCVLKKDDMDSLLKAWEFLGTDKMNIKPLLHWGWRCKKFLFSDNHPQVTFAEMFLYDTYEFQRKPEMRLPDRCKDLQEIQQFFDSKGLRKGRTVVLAPYAGSFISEIPTEFWENLAIRLKEQGYSVCTNCVADKEVSVRGTVPVTFPYFWAVDFVNFAGAFVALRSGLCDIVSSSNAKIAILYEDGFNASSLEYFGLVNMGIRGSNHTSEIIYKGNDEVIIENILSMF